MDFSHKRKRDMVDPKYETRQLGSRALTQYTSLLWNDGSPQGDIVVSNTDPETSVVVVHHVHSFILKSFCVYFRVSLQGQMVEAQTRCSSLGHHGGAWLAALAFMYTQDLDIHNGQTAIECYKLADYLEAECLRDACVAWVRRNCGPEDCCELFASGIELNSAAIVEITVECIGTSVSYEPESSTFWASFSRLSFELLETLLRSPKLTVVAEAALFSAVAHWAEAEERDAENIRRIVSLIDLNHLPTFVLADAVLSTSSTLAHANAAFAVALARAVKNEGVETPVRRRIFRGVVFANRDSGRMELFVGNPAGKLYGVPGSPSIRPRCVYITCNSRVFSLGGETASSVVVPTVDVLDLASGVTTSAPSMRRALLAFSCATTAQSIFLCGGTDIYGRASQYIDVYSPSQQRWSIFCAMTARRASCASVIVDGRLYVLGGIGHTGSVLSTVEVFDIATGSATIVGSTTMPVARHSHACVAVDDRIFVLGGSNDDDQPTETAMVFNIRSRTWQVIPDMLFARSGHSAAEFGGHIFVCGGAGPNGQCERFCTHSESWAQISLLSPQNTPMHPCTVLAV